MATCGKQLASMEKVKAIKASWLFAVVCGSHARLPPKSRSWLSMQHRPRMVNATHFGT